MEQITVRSLKQPVKEDINEDIEWFCKSLGILGTRDKQKTGRYAQVIGDICQELKK